MYRPAGPRGDQQGAHPYVPGGASSDNGGCRPGMDDHRAPMRSRVPAAGEWWTYPQPLIPGVGLPCSIAHAALAQW